MSPCVIDMRIRSRGQFIHEPSQNVRPIHSPRMSARDKAKSLPVRKKIRDLGCIEREGG